MTAPASNDVELTCARCGSYVARLVASLDVCRDCAERLLPEPLRRTLDARALMAGTAHVLSRVGLPCLAIALIFELPGDLLLWLLPDAPLSLQIGYFTLVTLIADLAILVMAHEALLGRTISIGEALVRGVPAYGAVLGARFRAGILTLLWGLLLVLPGLYKGAAYSLSSQVALFEPREAHQATEVSSRRTREHVWLLLGASLLLYAVAVGVPLGALLGFESVALTLDVSTYERLSLALDLSCGAISATSLALLTIVQQVVYEKATLEERIALDRA
ncbi:MAG: hypothetical protein J0L92_25825 [Deltaproteobacteria bacterium]|nr:hypothetical protein [Deltaproteobacteria bacterium]